MPIALQRNGSVTIPGSDFIHGMPCTSIRDRSFSPEPEDDSDSSSSSSIGRNSDSSEDSSDREDSGELQSSFKGPLDTVDDLEEGLLGKKGISKFYSGKSKSFTSLADATSTVSIQDIVKPEDPYAKKRKNLLAHNIFADRNRNGSLNGGGISKRSTSFVALSSSSSSSISEEGNSSSVSPPSCLPPLHPRPKRLPANASAPCPPRTSPWRSYSWSDLQSAHDLSGLAICSGDKGNKLH